MNLTTTAGPVFFTRVPAKVLGTERLIRTGYFRVEPGYRVIREKGSLDWLLLYTTKGDGLVAAGEDVLHLKTGDIVVIPQGVAHDYSIAPDAPEWELIWAHFLPRSHWQILFNWPSTGNVRHLRIGAGELHDSVFTILQEMDACYRSPLVDNEDFAMNALERALLLCGRDNPTSQQARIEPRIRKAMVFLAEHKGTPMNIGDVARHCGLSVSRLFHLFRDQVGTTPVEFLEQQRINHAKELLELSHFNVSEIAFQAGFASQAYFSRRFSRRLGISPLEYRKRYRAQ